MAFGGGVYPAEELARGAAYELFSADEVAGFERAPRPGSALPWRRFVHVTEVTAVHGGDRAGRRAGDAAADAGCTANAGWAYLHQLSQQPAAAGDPMLAAARHRRWSGGAPGW